MKKKDEKITKKVDMGMQWNGEKMINQGWTKSKQFESVTSFRIYYSDFNL
jgi:hypothetical protein